VTLATAAIVLGLCILFEAFFSGSELALIAADKVKLRNLSEQSGRRQRAIHAFLENPGELISTSLVGTNICVVLSTVVATLTFMERYPRQAELLSLAVMTPLVLVFGEIVPKSIFQSYADRIAPTAIYLLWFFRALFYPVVAVGSWLSTLALRLFGLDQEQRVMTREELSLLIQLPSREGESKITADEREMVTNIFEFKDQKVVDVMLPLSEVTALPVTATLEEVAQEIAEQQHTRLPLYRERVDQIIGIVHAFDLLRASGEEDICDLCRPAIFVPESQPAVDTFLRLQREGQQMAVVVDEYGGATGVVTIEDLLEEIVGEIDDEYDAAEPDLIVREPAGTYRVLGRAPVARLNERLKLALPDGEEYETVAGLLLDHLKRIPVVGETVTIEGALLTVTRATERAVEEVRLKPPAGAPRRGATRKPAK
jgi:CBS domain containing-hemolysin-like protein